MKAFSRLAVRVGAAIIFFAATWIGWLFLYSGALPGVQVIGSFAPTTASTGVENCVAPQGILVIPYSALGDNVRKATHAAERNIEMQVARSVLCQYQGKNIPRMLLEYKAALILKTRFTPEQLLTIYLNRAYFGVGMTGVVAASEHYYGITPDQLNLPQAAMVIGLIKAPNFYSPERYPERCKQRRDKVVDAMLRHGEITIKEANAAKESPLI